MSSEKYQFIAFTVPDYLATFFASKLNTQIKSVITTASHLPGSTKVKYLEIDRHTHFGTKILKSVDKSNQPTQQIAPNQLYLRISNYAGNNYDTPRGDRNFLTLQPNVANALQHQIKNDFNEALINFVQGAEFAHMQNGWDKSQKRKGIRKAAILKFCNDFNVSFNQKNLESFVKMIQRATKSPTTHVNTTVKKYYQALSC